MFDKKQPDNSKSIKNPPSLFYENEQRITCVARKNELKDILQQIEKTDKNSIPQHLLMTGQCGMGNSMLLNHIVLAITADKILSQDWLALRLSEAQSSSVTTLTQLWRNILEVLLDSLVEDNSQKLEIKKFLENLDSNADEKPIIDFLQQWSEKNQKRFLLLIDGSDLLLSHLSHNEKNEKADFGTSQLWKLRETLQNHHCFFWLGSSYQLFDSNVLYHDAFLNFFHHIVLHPLTLQEVQNCMQELANIVGLEYILKDPACLKTIYRLSGGNLRTMMMLYELLSVNEEDLQINLKRLLNDISPRYKARMDNIAEQPRKVLIHLFEHWTPVSLDQLSKISGLEESFISPQLQYLEGEGFIEKTTLAKTNDKGYQVTEQFFNIWYLMQNAPQRLRPPFYYLVVFMRLWFNTEQLIKMAKQQNDKLCAGTLNHLQDYEYSRVLAHSLVDQLSLQYSLEMNAIQLLYKNFPAKTKHILDIQSGDKPFITAIEYKKRLESLPKKLRQLPFKVNQKALDYWVDNIMGACFLSLHEKEQLANGSVMLSLLNFTELTQNFKDQTKKLARYFGQKAYQKITQKILSGDFFPDFPDSELAYKQLHFFTDNPKVYTILLYWYEGKHQDQYVQKAYQKAIELNPENADLWHNLAHLYQAHLYDIEQAEMAYKKAIELDPKAAHSYANLARLFVMKNKDSKEIDSYYQQVINLDAPHFLSLQAHLYLNHLDLADKSLSALAKASEAGDNEVFFHLKQQCKECYEVGLGLKLADLMQNNLYHRFLKPFILALQTVEGNEQALSSAPVEMIAMAKEIITEINKYYC